MITLNDNYDDIRKQIDYIRTNLWRCKTKKEAMAYMESYNTLVMFYFLCTGINLLDKKIKKNKYMSEMVAEQSNAQYYKFHQNFLDHKLFHKEMITSSFFDMVDFLEEFEEGEEYLKLFQSYHPYSIDKKEQYEILTSFFQEEDIVLKDIFDSLKKQGHFYYLPPDYSINEGNPLTLFNPAQNISNLFFSKPIHSIEDLQGLVHELGHVRDLIDIKTRISTKAQQMYTMNKSIYTETLSTEYEQRFLSFLIENNIHKEEAIRAYYHHFNDYLSVMDNTLLLTLLPDQYHLLAVEGRLSFNEVLMLVEGNEDICYNSTNLEEEDFPEFSDCLDYSYGLLLSPILMNDKEVRDQFLNIRHDYFDERKLQAIGITPERAKKDTMKMLTKYLK